MRILVVGAGAVGGYFGGRLAAAGRDVTFLVRPARAAELASRGLRIYSSFGDLTVEKPKTVLAEALEKTFDVIFLSCKAYDLEGAMASFARAVGPATLILPVLNGMRHLETLDGQFGAEHVLGGQCAIAATLNAQRDVVQLNNVHLVSFGERDGTVSPRVQAIADAMQGAGFEARASAQILAEMWEKWVFLASLAGTTCLFRAAVRDVVAAPGGSKFALGLFEECCGIAASEGYPVREAFVKRGRATLTAPDSELTASMLRDIERDAPVEADQILGDLLRRERASDSREMRPLEIAYAHLKAYESRRARLPESAPAAQATPAGRK